MRAPSRCRFTCVLLAALSLAALADPGLSGTPAAGGPRERLSVQGSDTIGSRLGIELAEAYHRQHPAVAVEWRGLGSSTAFVGLFDGSADLGAASRPINEAELAEAARLRMVLREHVIGYDGVAVFVHPANPLASLTLDELARIFQGKVTNFRQVGGPDLPIQTYSRPSYSGTHAFFRDKVLRHGNPKGPENYAPSTLWVEHTAALVSRVSADPGAISYGGMAFSHGEVKVVPVALGRGRPAVLPTAASVQDGSYPIFRPLYLYARGEVGGAAAEMLRFVLGSDGQQIVAQTGFVPLVASGLALAPMPELAVNRPAEAPQEPLRVFFGLGRVSLDATASEAIAQAARELRTSGATARLVGHADAFGSPGANERVAAARARAVYRELLRLGVAAEQLQVEGAGASQPLASNEDAGGRASNRRVDVVIYPAAAGPPPRQAGGGR